MLTVMAAVLLQLRQAPSRGRESSWHVDLPPQPFLDQVAGDIYGTGRLTYRIPTAGFALRHAASLVSILLESLALARPVSCMTSVFREKMPWILDAMVQIQDVKESADAIPLQDIVTILERCVACVTTVDDVVGGPALVEKGNAALVLLCGSALKRRRGFFGLDAELQIQRRVVAATLLHLAKASLQSNATGGLVKSHLADLLGEVLSEESYISSADFVACCRLLRDAASTLSPAAFRQDYGLPKLQDPVLRKLATHLASPTEKSLRSTGSTKRQKTRKDTEGSGIPSKVSRRLRVLVHAGLEEPLEAVFELASCVNPSPSARRCPALLTR